MKNTLTKKMAKVYSYATDEWVNINTNPNHRLIVALEKRGLIELRVDPTLTPDQVFMQTMLRTFDHWQWRKKP